MIHYNITQEVIQQIPFDDFYKGITIESENTELYKHFYSPSGKEHYRLLAYLSSLFNNSTILDIGTHTGLSALSLAYNESNTIHTFDIVKHNNPILEQVENIHFHEDNLFEREVFRKWAPTILECPFILVDVDPHNGQMELGFIEMLMEINYQGFVVWDAIYFFQEMRNNFWYKVNEAFRYDLTLVGHWSGTGVTTFNPNISFNKNNNNKWTLVTGYFDLTKYEDATSDIKERDSAHYLSHARSTMALPYNLIVYCEEQHLEMLQNLRPEYLRHRVLYRVVNFDALFFFNESTGENKDPEGRTFADYRRKINANRSGNPFYNKDSDNRNTASYYLLCMMRYVAMKQTIHINPFNSTHFGWINICIERMGYSNLIHLDEALSLYRDKFSTCYIDYIPEQTISDLPHYFQWGRCSMCSGFFTGNAYYMKTVSDLFENQFLEYLRLGYGHADEQLYSPVYFKNPDLFEHYYGDYQEMITNYAYVYERPSEPLRNFITNSFNCGNYEKCYEACQVLWNSFVLKKCNLTTEETKWLCYYFMMSQKNIGQSQRI